MLDIVGYISGIEEHVLIKKSEIFPNYIPGMDFDIVVSDTQAALKNIHKNFMDKDIEDYSIKVHRKQHTHFDIMKGNKLEVRLDLIDSFNFLKRIRLSNTFIYKLFSQSEQLDFDGRIINVPSKLDDYLIRYIEFIEYFEVFPAKEKHLFYIKSLATEEEWMELIEMTHKYIRFNREIFTKLV